MPSVQQDDALPCGAFDLTAEARYLQGVCIMYFTSKNLGPVIFCTISLNTSEAYLAIRCLHSGYFSFASIARVNLKKRKVKSFCNGCILYFGQQIAELETIFCSQ